MRPGQQHNRRNNRGRHQNGGSNGGSHNQSGGQRKGQNPLTRSYESNGPDVKVRGTPMHIAEKYMSLARDATSAGDPVLAENYLQHAEHYNRIIMAYREQQEAGGPTQQPQRFRQAGFDPNDPGDDLDDGQPDTTANDDSQGPPPVAGGEQPVERPMDTRNDRPERQERFDRGDRSDRQFNDRGDRGDRGDRSDRPFNRFDGDRSQNRDNRERPFEGQPGDNRQDRQFRRDRFDRNNRPQGDRPQGDRRDRFNEGGGPQRSFEPRADAEQRPDRVDRPDRPDRVDRPDRSDRNAGGFRQQGFDRGDRGDRGQDRSQDRSQDRTSDRAVDRPDRSAAGERLPPHERHIPERRQPPVQPEQPAPEWIAQDRNLDRNADRVPPASVQPVVERPVVERPAVERSVEPVRVVRSVAAPVEAVAPMPAAADPRPARAPPRKRAAPAAPSGVAFQEHDQPSFLKRTTRKPKAEPKTEPGDSKPE